ncbi:acyl-CoA N-acyltransferase [Hygrophoropsis aurantiaca]|uniref:Acyl-CoA N-acyltransferase n=1 Tax=Hygrophoropsis aurantiaca TaxID=72124 RepID=A0ACB8AR53_9AGAM|nr:acyl-CoA N-acyltransferase [Hygrophoropsis aurantiaca]
MTMSSAAVRKANKATSDELVMTSLHTQDVDGLMLRFIVATSSELLEDHKQNIWEIFEENMRDLYVSSSFGWDPLSKKLEMFDSLSRVILAEKITENTGSSEHVGPSRSKELCAYTIFRFEREVKQNVLYCYELQVARNCQRLGVGKMLTEQLLEIASAWKMQKVMLTVFKANKSADAFYRSIGFSIDFTSPGYEDEDGWEDEDDKCDYVILSRPIP